MPLVRRQRCGDEQQPIELTAFKHMSRQIKAQAESLEKRLLAQANLLSIHIGENGGDAGAGLAAPTAPPGGSLGLPAVPHHQIRRPDQMNVLFIGELDDDPVVLLESRDHRTGRDLVRLWLDRVHLETTVRANKKRQAAREVMGQWQKAVRAGV